MLLLLTDDFLLAGFIECVDDEELEVSDSGSAIYV